jgi:hypothetical protein
VGVHSGNTFSFFKWGTLAQKKGRFFTFKQVGGGTLAPGSAAPVFDKYIEEKTKA